MRLRAATALTFAVAAITLTRAAFSASTNYVEKRRVIHAGALAVRTIGPSEPMIFYVMSARDDIKPQGWSFENPIAAGNSMYKNQPGYWTVDLSNTSLESLSKFDVLYLSCYTPLGTLSFTTSERDKLRRFVDGGGCLWVDDPNPLTLDTTDANGFFLPGVNFATDSAGGTPTPIAMLHPLLTSPFWLSPQEIAEVSPSLGRIINPGYVSDFKSLPNPTMLSPIVALLSPMGGVSPTIGAIEYGSGRVVFTSCGIGHRIATAGINMSPISGSTSGTGMLAASPSHLKLAYNIVNWASACTTLKKDYRRTSSSLETLGAPLVSKWKLPGAAAPGTGLETSPVFWKNVIYYVAGQKLIALDANPPSDLDMDGNPDDGMQDPTSGSDGYDKLWEADLGKAMSSPTVASMLDPKDGTLIPKDFVFVMCDDGLVHIFEALPAVGGRLSPAPVERTDLWDTPNYANPAGSEDFTLCPPVVQNGWIYALGRNGVVYGHSPVLAEAKRQGLNTQKTPWAIPLNGNLDPKYAAEIKSGPIFGFIKNRTTGALVQSLSFFGTLGNLNPQKNDNIYSLPVFVSSDKLTLASGQNLNNPGTDIIVYKNSYPWPMSPYPAPDVWATNGAGASIKVSLNKTYWANPGFDIPIKFANQADIDPSVKVYVSYAMDFSSAYISPTSVCPRLTIPPTIVGTTGPGGTANTIDAKVIGTPALGPNDLFYMGIKWEQSPFDSTSLYSVLFDGTNSRIKWNYLLHGGGNIPDPSQGVGTPGSTIDISNTMLFEQAWGIHAKVGELPNHDPIIVPVKNLKIVGSPAVANGKVYVTAVSTDPDALKKSFLLCFKADQDFVIKINRPLRTPQGDRMIVSLWQPDLMTDPVTSAAPPSLAARPVPGDMIDYSTGTITVNDFSKLRVMGNFGGVITSTGTFTPSLPVWVFLNGNPVDPNEVDLSKWDNLLWTMALPDHESSICSGISSSPSAMGDYVYITCDDGYIFAINSDAKATYPNYKILDPDTKNVPWQENVGAGNAAVSLAGTGGILAVPSANGIKAFGTSSTLVTDNRRIMEISSEGNVTWSCDSVNQHGVGSSALNKPIVAQKFGPSDYLVVDSGNSRILRMDRSGNVAWVLSSFEDPNDILRSGEPKTISNPTDAKMWSEYETIGSNQYYVIHTLVVDSGNFRILDIVDRYGIQNGQVVSMVGGHTLNWSTSTSYRDQMYKFKTIQLVRIPGTTLKNQIWASVSNYGLKKFTDSTMKSSGGAQLGGAILALEYREKASADAQWTYSKESKVVGQLSVFDNGTALSGPTSFVVLDPVGPEMVICDTSHVYRTIGTEVKWSLDQSSYSALDRAVIGQHALIHPGDSDEPYGDPFPDSAKAMLPFSPQGITVIAPHRYIIANGYGGRVNIPGTNMPKFTGEVFEVVEGDSKMQWYAPSITQTWRMADKADPKPAEQVLMQKLKNAPNLDQPTCVQKLY